MQARRTAALAAARASGLASRLLGRGGGTALPGLIAITLDPAIIRELTAQLPCGSLLVSGTNGKTTTSRLLAGILERAGYRAVRNQSGSNLERGLASTLVKEADLLGRLPAAGHAIGLFEVDEAALPQVLRAITPRRLVLLDIFRDQLDRYGEVATVATDWSDAVRRLPPQTVVVANADDPLVAAVAESTPGNVVLFGIESAQRMATEPEHASDVKACPRCGGPVIYDRIFLGHLGHYRCSRCAVARPRPDVTARDVRLNGVRGSRFTLCPGGTELLISFPLPGMYNVYNAVGAAAAAHSLGVAPEHIQTGLEAATAAFGRMEPIDIDGAHAFLALAKNPTGLNEVLRTIVETPGPAHLLVMLNDNIADGRDVSWIWDADVEMLAGAPASILFSGTRAEDMALRFKYAGVLAGENPPVWEVQKVTREAVKRASREVRDGETLFIVPTYTAMLDVRQVLTEMGYVRPYWEE